MDVAGREAGMSKSESSEIRPRLPSLESLVEDHYDYLYRYAFRHYRCPDRSEEAVQETFLAATSALERFEGRSSPRTWLTSILRFKILDSLKKGQSTESVDFTDEDDSARLFDEVEHWRTETGPLLWGSPPEFALKQKEFLRVLEHCLGGLPEKVRQIFLLREMDGFSREEICEQTKLTANNVGVILYRARISLQHCLQSNWFHNLSRSEVGQ